MLTINQPVQYGYRPIHDLPTPPSTSPASPPLIHPGLGLELLAQLHRQPRSFAKSLSSDHEQHLAGQLMSGPLRGLPVPGALSLAQPPPPPATGPQQPPVMGLSAAQQAPPPPPPSLPCQPLPPAPSWQHVTETSMQCWLGAKQEEEKRRQEEEKRKQEEEKRKQQEERTRQESMRLEQRRIEHDLLRTSLQGGIPPAMVPVVFAGMGGGTLPTAALEWAQQYILAQVQQPVHAGALMPPGQVSPGQPRRESQPQQGHLAYSASAPGSSQGAPSGYLAGYPGSPTRPRGQSIPGPMTGARALTGGPGGLPGLQTGMSGPRGPTGPAILHTGLGPQSQQQQQPQQPLGSQHQEPQPSPIVFHHWQPPTSQPGARSGSDQPATPSVAGSPRKRKATGPQLAVPPPNTPFSQQQTQQQQQQQQQQYTRSPPFTSRTSLLNPPPGRRRGHARQRSDLGSYRATGRGRGRGRDGGGAAAGGGAGGRPGGLAEEGFEQPQAGIRSPQARDFGEPFLSQQQAQQQQAYSQPLAPPPPPPPTQQQQQQQRPPARSNAHSVSSLLSDNPPSPQFASGGGSGGGGSGGGGATRAGPSSSADTGRRQSGPGDRRSSPRPSDQ